MTPLSVCGDFYIERPTYRVHKFRQRSPPNESAYGTEGKEEGNERRRSEELEGRGRIRF